MAKTVVIDEIHLTVRVPEDLPESQADAVRRTLLGADFMRRLQQVVRTMIEVFPELSACRLSLNR